MNKADLVAAVAEKADITQKDTVKVINAVIEVISESISQGKEVRIVGFGTFKVRQRAARTGRNPKTGKPIEICAKTVPVFVPGKSLKEDT
ncbi:MAG: HU family DNA-binding protein [Eubacteriales bacterium]